MVCIDLVCVCIEYSWFVPTICSLIPRPYHRPVFDCLQYAKREGEGLGERVTCMTSGRHEGGGAWSL